MEPIALAGVQLFSRNFQGTPGINGSVKFPNFGVILEHRKASTMRAEGWDIRRNDEGQEWLLVHIPLLEPFEAVLTPIRGKLKELTANDLWKLDIVQIESSDVVIVGKPWKFRHKTGYKAYLKSIVVKES